MDGIVFKKDIANKMAERRKLLESEDALDLINCLISYIKEKTESRNTDIYAIDIGTLGFLHRKMYEVPTTMYKTPMYRKMVDDYCEDERTKPLLITKPLFDKSDIYKLEQLQNEYYTNNQFKAL